MSRHVDSARSYVFFARVDGAPMVHPHRDPGLVRPFSFDTHLDWLTTQLAPMNVLITHP